MNLEGTLLIINTHYRNSSIDLVEKINELFEIDFVI
jgi:hypothetical protein